VWRRKNEIPNKRTKSTAYNERFGATAAGRADLKDSAGMPPLRQAATTLCAMRGQPSSSADLKKIRLKILRNLTTQRNRTIFYGKVGFCRVRYAHTAPPTQRPKMGFAIFRLCPPTTLIFSAT